jgi:hypothetical protein
MKKVITLKYAETQGKMGKVMELINIFFYLYRDFREPQRFAPGFIYSLFFLKVHKFHKYGRKRSEFVGLRVMRQTITKLNR